MDTNPWYDNAERVSLDANLSQEERYARDHQPPKPQKTTVEFGTGWYHDAAIEDAKGAHAHPYR